MKNSTLIALIKRRIQGVPLYTHIGIEEIKPYVSKYFNIGEYFEPLVLFYPSDTYWVLICMKKLVYFKNNTLNYVFFNRISNKYFWEPSFKEILFDDKLILCDQLLVDWQTSSKLRKLELPIETQSIYAFCDALAFLVRKASKDES